MMTKYPAFLYKIDGFGKMAADAEVAHSIVKKALKLKWPSFLSHKTRRPFTLKEYIKDTKLQDALRGDPAGKMKRLVHDYGAASKEFPKGSFGGNLMESIRDMPTSAVLGTALLGTAPAAILAEKAYSNIAERKRLERAYRNMLRIYPDLQREKPGDVKRYFDYIAMYSPTVAENPHAAGSLIKRFVHSGGMLVDNSIIEGLLNVEKTKAQVTSFSAKPTGSTISNIARQLGSTTI